VDLAVKDLGDHGVRNSSKGGFDGRIVRSVGVEERGSQAGHRKGGYHALAPRAAGSVLRAALMRCFSTETVGSHAISGEL
jgi:hypothetical protein